jgi:hypothetical protein
MPKRKKVDEPAEPTVSDEPKMVSSSDINVNELFARLKEFENKALLDRLKILERKIDLVQKAQMRDNALLKEIKQHVSYLGLAYEELLNNLGCNEPSYHDDASETTANDAAEKSDKKWN